MSGEFKYCVIRDFDARLIYSFIDRLLLDTVYTIIPFVSTTRLVDNPFLVLSRQIVVTKHSDPKLINDFVRNQFYIAIR